MKRLFVLTIKYILFTVEDAKAIYDKHVRNINREITY